MNPLQVLRCASLMTPVDRLDRNGDEILLDWSGYSRVALDDGGRSRSVRVEGRDGRLQPYTPDLDLDALDREVIVTASPDLRMVTAIQIRYRTGTPVIIEDDGRMIGVVGDDEIYRGMLRQTSLGSDTGAGT